MSVRIVIFKLLGIMLVFSCSGKKPTEPDNQQTSKEMHIKNFNLPTGETRTFPSGFEIVSENGVTIGGQILIEPSADSGFTITAKTGDIVISGEIRVNEKATGSKSYGPNHLSKSRNQAAKGLSITLRALTGNLFVDGNAAIQAGRGVDGNPVIISSTVMDTVILGNNGGDGGDIILTALQGVINLPNNRDLNAQPVLYVGAGGDGGDVVVDRMRFDTVLKEVRIRSGYGGDSGQIILESQGVSGLLTAGDLASQANLVSNGFGGNGGDLIWDNTADGLIPGETERLEKTYPLESILLVGGGGGYGVTVGGDGGNVAYWSGRVINDVGDPVADVVLRPGFGGPVVPMGRPFEDEIIPQDQIPQSDVYGGDAGVAMGIGNNGWDGDAQNIDAPNGGNIEVRAVFGGVVREGVVALRGYGGDGNNSKRAETELPQLIKVRGGNSFPDFPFGIVAGSGGNAWNEGCSNGQPGGTGGEAGAISISSGYGGSILSESVVNGEGGNGGNIWTVNLGFPGKGGAGNPPGDAGCTQTPELYLGEGGEGTTKGQNGALLFDETGIIEYCENNGATCNADTTKPDSSDCTAWTFVIFRDSPEGFHDGFQRYRQTKDYKMTARMTSFGGWEAMWEETTTTWLADGSTITITQTSEGWVSVPDGIWNEFQPECDSENGLWWPDGSTAKIKTYYYQDGGVASTITTTISCNPLLEGFGKEEDWTCCESWGGVARRKSECPGG